MQTIFHYWQHTKILPLGDLDEIDNEIGDYDEQGDEGLTDDEIISMVKSNNDESKENLNKKPLKIISKKEL
ncbi:hypothetical protein C1646_762806 [Rhizophagus diaphanus]|nr:hypothetical protein C1646_762806 [Rhizophagus diaphanus] [Rhizophagus sp. MUCL 43196]